MSFLGKISNSFIVEVKGVSEVDYFVVDFSECMGPLLIYDAVLMFQGCQAELIVRITWKSWNTRTVNEYTFLKSNCCL